MKIYKDGQYLEVEDEITEAPVIPYEQIVVDKIREKYSIDDEFAILRQRDTKPEEFAEYNAYCEACKAEAKEILGV